MTEAACYIALAIGCGLWALMTWALERAVDSLEDKE